MGILSYSEIKDIMSDSNINPTYDEDAGVYYMTYGKGGANWASFDDAVSFQAKIELANSFGLGGVLVWAIDQDDKFYNALRGVTGKDVEPAIDPKEGYGAFTLDQCYITNCGESCTKGDVLMTKLNEDESSRGCSGKDHNARSCTLAHQNLIEVTMTNSQYSLLPGSKCTRFIRLLLDRWAGQLPWSMCCRRSYNGLGRLGRQ